MSAVKYFDTVSGTWKYLLQGPKGDTGPQGPAGTGIGDMVIATYDPANIAQQLVGLTATQTLTNKNLTSGTNTFPTFNQNTTGSAATLTTARTVQTNLASTSSASFNGSANITPGVTGTLPVGNGGSGRASHTAYALIAGNTTTTGAQTSIANGATGTVLKGAGTSAYPAFGTLASTELSDVATLATLTGVQTMTNKTINGASPTEVSYLAGVTSAVQTQINAKLTLAATSISGAGWLAAVGSATDKAVSPNSVKTYVESTAVTMTNKRITKRVSTTASSATPTPNADTDDFYTVTALAAAAAFAAPTGTPTEGQPLVIRIKDNATARALTWNAIYRAIGTILPASTVVSKTMYLAFIYNSADTKWDLVAYNQES